MRQDNDHRNPNSNDRDHLVGDQLEVYRQSLQLTLHFEKKKIKVEKSTGRLQSTGFKWKQFMTSALWESEKPTGFKCKQFRLQMHLHRVRSTTNKSENTKGKLRSCFNDDDTIYKVLGPALRALTSGLLTLSFVPAIWTLKPCDPCRSSLSVLMMLLQHM